MSEKFSCSIVVEYFPMLPVKSPAWWVVLRDVLAVCHATAKPALYDVLLCDAVTKLRLCLG